jgi:hypothetical protein
VTIYITPRDVRPEVIAAHQEKLYYEGDGQDGISRLVGTILIGDVPLPIVEKDGLSFPSLYPYVDFDNKRFVYDTREGRYIWWRNAPESSDVDIWHGVINPALGREWDDVDDVERIETFLDKTHDFYTKSGKFVPQVLPPRVFYYDGYAESLSADAKSMFKYALFIENLENIAYKRFTKYLLTDIMTALSQFQETAKWPEDEYVKSLGLGDVTIGDETMDSETLAKTPDIQTKVLIMSYLKTFYETINKKTLSDIQKFVHNAGRYNSGTTVRVDQWAIQMTLTDELALQTLKSSNDALMDVFDRKILTEKWSRPIPIFDSLTVVSNTPPLTSAKYQRNKIYQNYFFGTKSTEIRKPEQCTIARGSSWTVDSTFGKNILVEASTAYDIGATQAHGEVLKADTEEFSRVFRSRRGLRYSCFQAGTNKPKLQTYYGGNSILRVLWDTQSDPNLILSETPWATSLTGMVKPIYSLWGMKESPRIEAPSIAHCLSGSPYQYTVLQPYVEESSSSSYEYASVYETCATAYPKEWTTTTSSICGWAIVKEPRFTCISELETSRVIPTLSEAVMGTAASFASKIMTQPGYDADGNLVTGSLYSCSAGWELRVDGKKIKDYATSCPVAAAEVSTNSTFESLWEQAPAPTNTENLEFHTIPSIYRHASPTTEEIAAAQSGGVTPSLAIDMERFVEFITPNGHIARIPYPNFFSSEAPIDTIANFRSWLTSLSQDAWNPILQHESLPLDNAWVRMKELLASGRTLPTTIIDWNTLISDEMIIKILQAKNWLAGTPTQKYQSRLEASLSFSQLFTGALEKNIPSLTSSPEGYEIAYLGLSPFIPRWESAEDDDIEAYDYALGTLQWLNFSERDSALDDPESRPTAQCGPPDGVALFKWPSAIQCWIKSLLPVRIKPGSCGGNTIWIDKIPISTKSAPPAILRDSTKLGEFYQQGKLVFTIPRTAIEPGANTEIQYHLDHDGTLVSLPTHAHVELKVTSITSDGKTLLASEYAKFLEIANPDAPYTEKGSSFLVSSVGPLGSAKISATLTIPLPDGTKVTIKNTDLTLRVTDEYIDITPALDGIPTATIDTTSTGTLNLIFTPKRGTGETISSQWPYTLTIADDVDGRVLAQSIVITGETYTLPDSYRDEIGVYRLSVTDRSGRGGESTLAVRSGPVAKMEFHPLSSTLARESESLGVLRLLDAKGNLISPTLLHMTATIGGGSWIDSDSAPSTQMKRDIIEAETILRYRADDSDTMKMDFSLEDPNISLSTNLSLIETPRLGITRRDAPRVGWGPVELTFQILDRHTGQVLSGFDSLITLDIPEGAWSLSQKTVPITHGRSDPVMFSPGKIAGDHVLTADIVGIGVTSEKKFNVLPWEALYIDGSISDTEIEFSLRDRYGNLAPESLWGILKGWKRPQSTITFIDGTYTTERSPGYWRVDVPALKNAILHYEDHETTTNAQGVSVTKEQKTFTGISMYQLFVPDEWRKYNFLPDYNARYTILAWDSYLSEASQILYETDGGASSSLAVSTLLTSPYEKETLFSLYPSWGYAVGSTLDTAIDVTLRNLWDTIILDAYDSAGQVRVARVAYPVRELDFSSCQLTEADIDACWLLNPGWEIRLSTFAWGSYVATETDEYISLTFEDTPKLTYHRDTGISLAPGVELIAHTALSKSSLVADIEEYGERIGRLSLHLPEGESVALGDTESSVSRLTLDADHTFARSVTYGEVFRGEDAGFDIIRRPSGDTLDSRLLWPSHTESLGALLDVPGVGWHGNNRLLLSFAAGDTVGEATRWFHDYTMINLWDPVAHLEIGVPGTEREWVDRSIGTQIAWSSERRIQSYKHGDMDGDGLEDIVIIYSDGFLELLLNTGGSFRKTEKIAYIPDMTSLGVELGDFTGDRHADIITLDHSGSLLLLDNTTRKIRETPIELSGDGIAPQGITQLRVYDMDTDGRSDIVYLTESWELGILYGSAKVWVFDERVLDETLWVSLWSEPSAEGGAVRANVTPIDLLSSPSTSTWTDESVLNSEVYYTLQARTSIESEVTTTSTDDIDNVFSTSLTDPNTVPSSQTNPPGDVYVKSEYALAYGLSVSRRYENLSAGLLESGDRIRVEIEIKNTGTSTVRDLSYLDKVPKIFEILPDNTYTSTLGSQNTEEDLFPLSWEEYELYFRGMDIPAGQTLTLRYEVKARPMTYGKMIVDNLERWRTWDDPYGDVGFETSTTCGDDMILWVSGDARTYTRTTRSFDEASLPDSIATKLIDTDKDGIPDSMDTDRDGDGTTDPLDPDDIASRMDTLRSVSDTSLTRDATLVNANISTDGRILDIGFSSDVVHQTETILKNLTDGLACGFGWWGCFSSPINWAPLAPWNDISVLGNPYGDGLKLDEWLPIFSALTGIPIYGPWWCFPMPFVWPPSPIGYETACQGWQFSAGGYLWVDSSANFIRAFVTPTLTLGMGAAICLGPARAAGQNPLYPLISYGNCIVTTKPLPVCKWDGSDADGSVIGISGLGSTRESWNSQSCTMRVGTTLTESEDINLRQDIISYLKSPDTTRLNSLYNGLMRRGWRSGNLGWPLLEMWDGNTSGTSIDISLDSSKPLTVDSIVKVQNKRIAWYPEYIMDWVTRQTEEITNKLLTLPNLIIVPPQSFGPNAQYSGNFSDFTDRFSQDSLKKWFSELEQKMWSVPTSNTANTFNRRTIGKTSASRDYNTWLDEQIQKNASSINSASRGVSQMRAAYQFMGSLPFIRVEKTTIPVSIPWLLPQDLDRYARSLKQYQNEISATKKWWCEGKSAAECADIHSNVGLGWLQSQITQNLRRIEEWRRFPEKIQKYVTWKQRYVAQMLCNVDAWERMITGWYRDNGIRFKKWAEFYVLMKTIVSTWQPFLDLWREKDRSCAVCQNQRWDLKYWKFKMISAVIPQIPILQFPKWPDIVLDLSDVRLGVLFRVPDFSFQIAPIRLPELPNLWLPDMPSVSITGLPKLDILPPVPSLPDLPDLPSFPTLNLPNLPPPPKLPKLFGAVSVGVNIFKLYTKIQCYMEKTFLVPEDYVGATIAQRTDRQGTLPFDFLNVRYPQIALSSLREIRVSTHVDFQLKSDFLAEFARAAVKPLNQFRTDFARIPKKIAPDLDISTPQNKTINLQSSIDIEKTDISDMAELSQVLRNYASEMLDVEEFTPYIREEMLRARMDVSKLDRALWVARRDADTLGAELITRHEQQMQWLRDYLRAEEAETRELERSIDRLSKVDRILSLDSLPHVSLVSQAVKESDNLLDTFESITKSRMDISTIPADHTLERSITDMRHRMTRLMAAETRATSPQTSSLTSWYAPRFEGIYILLPESRSQTKLFDYSELLRWDETVDIIDIDKDEDKDYIYMIEWSLYIKYSHSREFDRPRDDTSPQTEDIDMSLLPESPNFFSEQISTPWQISIDFSAADPADTTFRLEFYDRYLEWDKTRLRGEDSPDTPRVVVDLSTDDALASRERSQGGISSRLVSRALESVWSSDGLILQGMRVKTLARWQEFTLSEGRALYTGNSVATLLVTDIGTKETKTITLDRFREHMFPRSISATIQSGKVYILSPSGSEKIPYDPDMIGMPLLPWVRVLDPSGAIRISHPSTWVSSVLAPSVEYRHISLGAQDGEYTAAFTYPNGYYSARLTSLRTGHDIHAGVTLLAPLASLDRSSPVITLTEQRVPVYQSKSIPLSEVVSDMSDVTIRADDDITVDTNRNWVFEDDFTTQSDTLSISSSDIKLGTYHELGRRVLLVEATDTYGNTTTEPLSVEIYAPIPQIRALSQSGSLVGSLDEPLLGEPVHIFRVREGDGMRLIDPIAEMTDTGGVFTFSGMAHTREEVTLSGLTSTSSLSPSTTLPSLESGFLSKVSPATATTPMRITFLTGSESAFTTAIIPPPGLEILEGSASQTKTGASLRIQISSDRIRIIRAGLSDPTIPWGRYIVSGVQPLFAIDTYGQVYQLEPSVRLMASESQGHLMLTGLQWDTPLMWLEYSVDFFLTAK